MAISSAGTYLLISANASSNYAYKKIDTYSVEQTYVILADIKSFPETGSAPERIETTTLSNKKKRTYIDGLQDTAELSFTANFDKELFLKLQSIQNSDNFAIGLMLSDGSFFGWYGTPSVYLNGGEINSVVEMTINVSAESEIKLIDTATHTVSTSNASGSKPFTVTVAKKTL